MKKIAPSKLIALKKNTFLLTFLLTLNFSFAQGIIEVEVLNKESKPISYASIEFLGTYRGIIADYNGQFSLPLRRIKGITKIKISSIGYESLEIALDTLSTTKLNTLILKQKIEELNTVVLRFSKSNIKEIPAIRIVKKAVNSIETNLSKQPHSLVGYYRDYQIYKDGEYYNLNEGIIEQFDEGILTHKLFDKNNQSALYKFKPNLDYKVDFYLSSAYKDEEKYIKDFKIFNYGGNELSILNAHNPIRIFNDKSFSYINKLEDDFFINHTFEKGKKFTTNDDQLITIHFKEKRGKIYSKHRVKGEILISLIDYSIHRFKYAIYNNKETTSILNIDISYKKKNDIMYLNYMSFNNKFYLLDKDVFREKNVFFNGNKNSIEIEFNRDVDLKTLKKSNFKVSIDKKKAKIAKIEIVNNKKIHLIVKKIDSTFNEQTNNLLVSIKKLKDINGRLIYEGIKKPAYQFREFFVQEVFENKKLNSEIEVIQKLRPLSEAKINTLDNIDNYIINSPLMNRKLF